MGTGAPGATPSGAQYQIRHGEQRATVVEVGGGLREYLVGGRPVLDGYPPDAVCDGARGQLLLPWPNRLADGRYRWDGVEQQLPLTEPERRCAIHGLARWTNWTVVEHGVAQVSLRQLLHPQPGWPFTLDCQAEYALGDSGLRVRVSATNLSARPCPYGLGAHPYLTVGTERIDDAHLQAPADYYYTVDDRLLPTGRASVAGTAYDLRAGRRIGDLQLDLAFGGLRRDDDGRARVALFLPDGPWVRLWLGEGVDYLELFTGDSLPDPGRRRRGLGVEPMTCAPDAFHSGDGLVTLPPGGTHVAEWGVEPDLG